MIITEILFWIVYFLLLYTTIFIGLVFFENGIQKNKKKLTKIPRVSILIPAYNEQDTIGKTIKSVLNLNYAKNKLDIIVINDGSTDKTEKIVKKFTKKGITLINQKNRGKAAALNNGLKHAKGEFVACLDADSVVEKNTLKKMVAYFSDNVHAVTPIMKVYRPKTLLQKLQQFEYTIAAFLKMILSSIDCIHVTPGPFTIYRTKTIKQLGGFDENSIVEDQEIAFRLQTHNKKIVQSTDGEALSIAPRNFRELFRQRSRWYRGSLLNLNKYRRMLFNPKYGDFGTFQLPSLLLGIFVAFFVLAMFVQNILIPIFRFFHQLFLINFDIKQMTYSGLIRLPTNLEIALFSLNIAKLILIMLFFVINIYWLMWAYKMTSEKMTVHKLIPLIFFFLIYYIIISFMWLGSIIELLMNKKGRW